MKNKLPRLQTIISDAAVDAFILYFNLVDYQFSVKSPVRQTVLGVITDQFVSSKPMNLRHWTAR